MIAAGVLFYATKTGRFLFLLRNNSRSKNTWGLPGGKIKDEETVIDGLHRELNEEIGSYPTIIKKIPLESFTSMDSAFTYHSYIFVIENEFIPILNSEHDGWCWTILDKTPKPLHPGLWNSLSTKVVLDKINLVIQMN
jgi:8-oxo-dGTP pyrophosphatase MutT (NUDIX family)